MVAHADVLGLVDVRFVVDRQAQKRATSDPAGGRIVFAWAEGALRAVAGGLPDPVLFVGPSGTFRSRGAAVDRAGALAFIGKVITGTGCAPAG